MSTDGRSVNCIDPGNAYTSMSLLRYPALIVKCCPESTFKLWLFAILLFDVLSTGKYMITQRTELHIGKINVLQIKSTRIDKFFLVLFI